MSGSAAPTPDAAGPPAPWQGPIGWVRWLRRLLVLFYLYLRNLAGLWRDDPDLSAREVFLLLRWFRPWARTMMTPGLTPLADRRPWITFPAQRKLDRRIRPEWVVFEYGTGGSSLYFTERVRRVVSVEHDADWMAHLEEEGFLGGAGSWEVHLVPPAPSPGRVRDHEEAASDEFASHHEDWEGLDFRAYVETILSTGDEAYDAVLVDGRCRPACVRAALRRVRPGGWIVWDNTDRERYRAALEDLPEGVERWDYPGPVAHAPGFSRTTLLRLPGGRTEGAGLSG